MRKARGNVAQLAMNAPSKKSKLIKGATGDWEWLSAWRFMPR